MNEAVVAKRIEFFLPKDRILEVYLNVVEWGPGIFGAEAAARTYFDRSAKDLTLDQAAALAATLPHPLTSNPAFQPSQMAWRKAHLLSRLRGPPPGPSDTLQPPEIKLSDLELPEFEGPIVSDTSGSGRDTLSEKRWNRTTSRPGKDPTPQTKFDPPPQPFCHAPACHGPPPDLLVVERQHTGILPWRWAMQYRTRSDSVSPRWTIGLAAAFLYLLPAPGISAQTTFTVNTATDEDDGTCDAAHCSLREAITAANLDAVGGIIHFSIPGAGPHTIQPLAALPALEGDVIIDGTSEPDFAGTPVIELDGRLAGGAHGIESVGSQNLIRGLVINRFEWNGIQIQSGCTFNVIEGNFIGTDVTGTIGLGNGNEAC